MSNKKVLIIHTWGIGDWMMFSPNIRDIAAGWPGCKIEVGYGNPQVKPVLGFYSEITSFFHLNWKNFLVVAFKSWFAAYDALIFTCGISLRKSEFLSLVIRAKQKIAVDRTQKGSRLIKTVPYKPELHLLENNQNLMSLVGLAKGEAKVYFKAGNEEKEIPGSVLIHPGSDVKGKYRRWPAGRFKAVAERLLEQNRVVSVLLGPSEIELLPLFATIKHENFLVVHGQPFKEIPNVIARHEYLLNSDSGIGHIAAALNKKVISIFGPANPIDSKPHGSTVIAIQSRANLDCMPCVGPGGKYGCEDPKCMDDISVATVLEQINYEKP